MTLDEINETRPQVSAARVRYEIKRHSVEWSDFIAQFGEHEFYDGAAVLRWLGW